MQRAIQNTQAATRRRSRTLRVAGSTLTANVAFAVLKYAALTAAGVLLFRWGQEYALAERGYEAIGGEALLLGLPLFWYLTETTIRDTVRDFRKRGRAMLKIRRIKTDKFKTAAFWIEKRDNEYIACRTLVNALLGIASPSIMSRGQEALKKAYETRRI